MKWTLKSVLTLVVVIALILFVGTLITMMFIKDMLTTELAIMIITAFVLFATNIANYYFTRKEDNTNTETIVSGKEE
jgi:c-di-AMP phosphodiesterase-like protein